MNRKGITLIELVIFILVGGIFVPLAYIAFTSVVRDSTRPETAGKARFIAEAKMEDITKDAYDIITVASTAYVAVNTDSRFTDASYNGYQWRWEITDIAYEDDVTRNTTIKVPDNWSSGKTYKVGDYAKPTNYPTSPYNNFYRVYFQERKIGNRYEIGDLVRPTTPDNFFYKSVEPLSWVIGKTYNLGDMVSTTLNNHYYKCVKPPPWQRNKQYNQYDLVSPTPAKENGHYYRANWLFGSPPVSSSDTEPNWPLSGCVVEFQGSPPFSFDLIQWCEYTTMTSGGSQPTWRTDSIPFFDGTVTWQEDTTLTTGSSAQPTLPFDGSITWQKISATIPLSPGGSEPSWTVDTIVAWQPNTSYAVGTKIRPTVSNNHFYICTSAGTSGASEPLWPTTEGATIMNGTVKWQEKSTISDNNVSWIRSTPYKFIKVYVRPPNCGSDTCTYIATGMVIGRNYTTRP